MSGDFADKADFDDGQVIDRFRSMVRLLAAIRMLSQKWNLKRLKKNTGCYYMGSDMEKLMNRLGKVLPKHDKLSFAQTVGLPANLRPDFRAFYEAFNPSEFRLRWFLGEFTMPGYQGIESLQIGYATNANDGTKMADWPDDQTVFADSSNDPFFTNLTAVEPIYFSRHGMGRWELNVVSETLPDLFAMLVCWKEVEHAFGGKLMTDDFEYLPPVFDAYIAGCKAEGISANLIEALIGQQ